MTQMTTAEVSCDSGVFLFDNFLTIKEEQTQNTYVYGNTIIITFIFSKLKQKKTKHHFLLTPQVPSYLI